MKSIVLKVALVAMSLGAAVFALAGTASATHVSAVITAPDEATVGEPAVIQAALHTVEGGAPLAGMPVVFYADTSFGGVEGEVELGRAVTDENGVAVLGFKPRIAGDHVIRVEYAADDASEPEVATTSISVAGGSQLYRSTAGVSIPGLNVWLLIALVAGVWAILLSVAIRVIVIAYAGANGESGPEIPASGAR